MSNLKNHTHTQLEKNVFPVIYIAGLLLAFHYYLIVYVNSSFLSQYIDEKLIGLLYIAGALFNLFIFTKIPRILQRLGNYKLIIFSILVEIICIITLAFVHNLFVVAAIFIIHHAVNPFILFSLDLFLEDYSNDDETGSVRGIFLSVMNLPAIIATFLLSFILVDNEFWKVYALSALCLIPLLMILFYSFKHFRDPVYKPHSISETIRTRLKDKDIYNIFIDNFLLQLFYSFVIVYMPIYLFKYVGFSLSEITLIYSITLFPFIILQIPVGRIADKKLGEKEFLILGFVIMSVAIIIISMLQTKSFLAWTLVILAARIGACLIEITTETYFFKHADKTDSGLISLFRMVAPTAHIASIALATALLFFIPYNYLFFIFGCIILIVGLRHTIPLKDTR